MFIKYSEIKVIDSFDIEKVSKFNEEKNKLAKISEEKKVLEEKKNPVKTEK